MEFIQQLPQIMQSETEHQKILEKAIELLERRNEEEAIKILDYLIEQKSDSLSYIYFLKAMGYYRLRDFSTALVMINISLNEDNNNYRSYACKGDIYQKMGDNTEAIACYHQAITGLPDDPFLLNNLGTLYIRMDDLESARNVFMKLNRISPRRPDYLFNLGFVLYKLREYDSALLYVESGIKMQPDDAGLYNLLGQILGMQGKKTAAKSAFKKSVTLNPIDNPAITNLEILKRKK